MIRINLLPQKRPRRGVPRAPSDPTQKQVWYGVAALAAFGALVFFAVDKPRRDELSELRAQNDSLQADITAKRVELAGSNGELPFAELQKAEKESKDRAQAINRLIAAKVVPANVLHELGKVLTAREIPTMTEDMGKRTGNGAESDPNKRFQLDWDPSHVWLSGYTDTGGAFRLEGGAQAESDVTQLAKRLAASVYFKDVTPSGGERVADRDTGLNYYKFVITGKVAY